MIFRLLLLLSFTLFLLLGVNVSAYAADDGWGDAEVGNESASEDIWDELDSDDIDSGEKSEEYTSSGKLKGGEKKKKKKKKKSKSKSKKKKKDEFEDELDARMPEDDLEDDEYSEDEYEDEYVEDKPKKKKSKKKSSKKSKKKSKKKPVDDEYEYEDEYEDEGEFEDELDSKSKSKSKSKSSSKKAAPPVDDGYEDEEDESDGDFEDDLNEKTEKAAEEEWEEAKSAPTLENAEEVTEEDWSEDDDPSTASADEFLDEEMEPAIEGIFDGLSTYQIDDVKTGYKGKKFEETFNDAEWDTIVGGNEDIYIIEEGDTLWDICNRLLDNPYYWPKLWQLNQYIANPHVIYPGDELHFFPGSDVVPPSMTVVKKDEKLEDEIGLKQGEEPEESEADKLKESTLNRLWKQQFTDIISPEASIYRINYHTSSVITEDELQSAGMIVDAKTERSYLSILDRVQLEMTTSVSIGDRFSIFREDGELEHPHTGDDFGYKNVILGELLIVAVKNGVIEGKIINQVGMIKRGDLLSTEQVVFSEIKTSLSDNEIEGYILTMDKTYYSYAGAYTLVHIDLGAEQGIGSGNMFRVLRQEILNDEAEIDEDDAAVENLGFLMVVAVQKRTSVAIILSSKRPLVVGDKIMMLTPDMVALDRENKAVVSEDEEYSDEFDDEDEYDDEEEEEDEEWSEEQEIEDTTIPDEDDLDEEYDDEEGESEDIEGEDEYEDDYEDEDGDGEDDNADDEDDFEDEYEDEDEAEDEYEDEEYEDDDDESDDFEDDELDEEDSSDPEEEL